MKYLSFAIFLIFQTHILFSQKSDTSRVTIVFAGDIMGHGPQYIAAFDSATGKYNYEPCFRYIKPFIDSADLAIPNLEVTFGGKPYTSYPTFSSPDDLAGYIIGAGFNILAMANNHCYDKGKKGFQRTINLLDSLNIKHLGTYIDSSQRANNYPLLFEIKGIKIALLNYTYGTNGIQVEKPNIVNYINKDIIVKDLAKADSLKADYKIAIMHWGVEYQNKPNKDQAQMAKFLAAHGCNAIIGSHPHVVQTFEVLRPDTADSAYKVLVFYSMGNLVSNQRDRYRDGGAMFCLTLQKQGRVKAVEYSYLPYWVYKGAIDNKYQYYIIPVSYYKSNKGNLKLPDTADKRISEFEDDAHLQFPNLKESDFFAK